MIAKYISECDATIRANKITITKKMKRIDRFSITFFQPKLHFSKLIGYIDVHLLQNAHHLRNIRHKKWFPFILYFICEYKKNQSDDLTLNISLARNIVNYTGTSTKKVT